MLIDGATPFDNQPELFSLHAVLVDFTTRNCGVTLVCETPFMINRDGSLYLDDLGDLGTSSQSMHHDLHDLWDELLLASYGLKTNRYTCEEMASLKNRSTSIEKLLVDIRSSSLLHERQGHRLN